MRFSGLLVCAELRWFRLWLGIGLALIAGVIFLSLTPPIVKLPAEHFDKLFHAANYALIMGWFVQLYRGGRSYLLLALAFITLGIAIEILQGFHPMRYFDVLDMLANAAGVVLVWLLARGAFTSLLQRLERRVAR